MQPWLGRVKVAAAALWLLQLPGTARGETQQLSAWAAALPAAATPQPKYLVAFRAKPDTPDGVQLLPLPERLSGNVRAQAASARGDFAYSLKLNPQRGPAAADELAQRVLALAGADLALELTTAAAGADTSTWKLWAYAKTGVKLVYAAERKTTGISNVDLGNFIRTALGYDGEVLAQAGDLVLARLPSHGWVVGTAALALDHSSRLLRVAHSEERPGSTLLRLVRSEGDLATLRIVAATGREELQPGTKLEQEDDPNAR